MDPSWDCYAEVPIAGVWQRPSCWDRPAAIFYLVMKQNEGWGFNGNNNLETRSILYSAFWSNSGYVMEHVVNICMSI